MGLSAGIQSRVQANRKEYAAGGDAKDRTRNEEFEVQAKASRLVARSLSASGVRNLKLFKT